MERKLEKVMVAGVALAALLLLGMPGTGSAGPQSAADKPVKATGDIKPPKIIKMVQPVYPEEARKQGIEGMVILEATADANGKVQKVNVLRGVGGLNQAAMDAVKQWTYEPMIINGKPMPVVFTVTVRFTLKDKAGKEGVEGGVKGGVEGGVAGGVTGGVAGGVEGGVKGGGAAPQPKLIKMSHPVYPEEARKQGIEGDVVVEATLGVDGKVKEAKVVRSVAALDQAALDAVKQWVYEPVIIEGKPKTVKFTVTVRFKLN
jgi:TonB family protein